MRFLGQLLKRLLILVLGLVLLLLAPVGYNEAMCRGTAPAADTTYRPLITDPAQQRPEARTLLTYPEWHIVHAYEDYAEVIRTGDPHDFGYFQSVAGFWTSLCSLSKTSAAHGGFPWETKQMVYTIGVSFTAELALKALYEETLGRLFAGLRGPERSPLDDLSAQQAADYAVFLQQVPWYRWDFRADAAALRTARTDAPRDRERALALGLEFRAKAAYAGAIAAAVAGVGADELTIRMIVTGARADLLASFTGITVIAERAEGIEIETPRYREFSRIVVALADAGATIIEVAGNDDILYTALSSEPWASGELIQFQRQGFGDYRHLFLVPVTQLTATLKGLKARGLTLEHVHDY